jgi:hypothetical protein
MKKLLLITLIGVSSMLNAQVSLGTIKGKVYTTDSVNVNSFARLSIEVDGNFIGAVAKIDGSYEFKDVKPGIYNIKVKRDTVDITFSGVEVNPDQITMMNLYMPPVMSKTIEVSVDGPKIDVEHVEKITGGDIKYNINRRDPVAMIVNKMSEVSVNENNEMIIRGSRAGDVVYFVDGVKMTTMQSVPGASVRGMSVYTGGIPAKYGDTTGGVVILETKSYFDLYYEWKASQSK